MYGNVLNSGETELDHAHFINFLLVLFASIIELVLIVKHVCFPEF